MEGCRRHTVVPCDLIWFVSYSCCWLLCAHSTPSIIHFKRCFGALYWPWRCTSAKSTACHWKGIPSHSHSTWYTDSDHLPLQESCIEVRTIRVQRHLLRASAFACKLESCWGSMTLTILQLWQVWEMRGDDPSEGLVLVATSTVLGNVELCLAVPEEKLWVTCCSMVLWCKEG